VDCARGESMTTAWIAIITMDRPAALRGLCHDLIAQSRAADITLTLFFAENSEDATAKAENARTYQLLRGEGHDVIVDDSAARDPIDAARERLRAMIAKPTGTSPAFIWMLDDDVRLTHLTWSGATLEARNLHNHLQFLIHLASQGPPDVLIGEVTGDPPIPPIGTYASRFVDLEWNLAWLADQQSSAPLAPCAQALAALNAQDAYYDFSVERASPTWAQPIKLLPRSVGMTVGEGIEALLQEASHLPFGVSLTRPILADQGALSEVAEGVRRGANCVFFDHSACVDHCYPSALVGDVRTRRSDMIGARLLATARPGRVKRGRFSVLHMRPRGGAWPTTPQLIESLLADTFGALLARAVDESLGGDDVEGWYRARIAQIQGAVASLQGTLQRLARGGERAWGLDASRLSSLVEWGLSRIPGAARGRLPGEVEEALSAPSVLPSLRARAASLTEGLR
jgi:hypothetical protein